MTAPTDLAVMIAEGLANVADAASLDVAAATGEPTPQLSRIATDYRRYADDYRKGDHDLARRAARAVVMLQDGADTYEVIELLRTGKVEK